MKQTSKLADNVIPFSPKGDKVSRQYEAAKWCEKGMVHFPPPTSDFPWMFDFEEEIFLTPNSRYMDQGDAFAQLCDYLSFYLAEGLAAQQRRGRQ